MCHVTHDCDSYFCGAAPPKGKKMTDPYMFLQDETLIEKIRDLEIENQRLRDALNAFINNSERAAKEGVYLNCRDYEEEFKKILSGLN